MASQEYAESDVGRKKVDAMEDALRRWGFSGSVLKYDLDIDVPGSIQGVLECDVYISAVDTYESRCNFYYYVVSETKTEKRIYFDAGSEKYMGHLFHSRSSETCIFCLHWMFARAQRTGVCSVRGTLPELITDEKIPIAIAALVETEGSIDKAVIRFNQMYTGHALTLKDAKRIESGIEPNLATTNEVLASVLLVMLQVYTGGTIPGHNYILYSGNGRPVFHRHFVRPDPDCPLSVTCPGCKNK